MWWWWVHNIIVMGLILSFLAFSVFSFSVMDRQWGSFFKGGQEIVGGGGLVLAFVSLGQVLERWEGINIFLCHWLEMQKPLMMWLVCFQLHWNPPSPPLPFYLPTLYTCAHFTSFSMSISGQLPYHMLPCAFCFHCYLFCILIVATACSLRMLICWNYHIILSSHACQ